MIEFRKAALQSGVGFSCPMMDLPSYHQHSTFNDRSQIMEFKEPSRRILPDPGLRAFTYRKDHPRGFRLETVETAG